MQQFQFVCGDSLLFCQYYFKVLFPIVLSIPIKVAFSLEEIPEKSSISKPEQKQVYVKLCVACIQNGLDQCLMVCFNNLFGSYMDILSWEENTIVRENVNKGPSRGIEPFLLSRLHNYNYICFLISKLPLCFSGGYYSTPESIAIIVPCIDK